MRIARTFDTRLRWAASGTLWLAVAQLVLAAAGRGSDSVPQQPAPRIKVAVDYVHVDVAVTDRAGRFVRDLQAGDFEVLEDGKVQPVSSFALVDAASATRDATPAPGAAEPDVTSNALESAGRIYVLVLDDLHVDALRSARVKTAARRFIEQYLRPGDLAAVIHTSGRADAGQDFTPRQSLLLAAVEKFTGRKLRSRVLEALDEYQRRSGTNSADPRLDRAVDPLDTERADHARRTLQTLQQLGDVLARAPGRRKTVLLISEGIEYPLNEGVGQTSTGLTAFTSSDAPGVRQGVREAIGAAARANITIYGVDPRGLATTGDETIEVSAFPENPQIGLSPSAFQDELRQAQSSLQILSDATGGTASIASNNLDGVFDRIVRESGTYYMLGYQSANRRTDGSYRRIAVRVRRPDVQVKARAGYVAAKPSASAALPVTASAEPSAALRDALNAPLPIDAAPLRMFAVPVRGAGDESVAVGIEADAGAFRLTEKDGFYVGQADLAVIALDAQAKVKTGDRQTIRLRLKPETYAAVQAHGLRMFVRLALPAGRYQLRAAVTDPASGATGSAFFDVDVPDFHRAPLAISGLAIAASLAAATPTPRPDPVFEGSLPFPPTAVRAFPADETLIVLFEVYRQGAAGPVDLTTTVRDAAGRVVFRTQEQVTEEKIWEGSGGFGYTVRVPLSGMPAGSYALRVEAHEARSPDVAARQVPFTIAR